jgi:hypothetical protein
VILSDEDLDAVALDTVKMIDIDEFVPADSIRTEQKAMGINCDIALGLRNYFAVTRRSSESASNRLGVCVTEQTNSAVLRFCSSPRDKPKDGRSPKVGRSEASIHTN